MTLGMGSPKTQDSRSADDTISEALPSPTPSALTEEEGKLRGGAGSSVDSEVAVGKSR